MGLFLIRKGLLNEVSWVTLQGSLIILERQVASFSSNLDVWKQN